MSYQLQLSSRLPRSMDPLSFICVVTVASPGTHIFSIPVYFKTTRKQQIKDILALLDYVSSAHEIEICLSFICPSSIYRTSVRQSVRVAIISESNAQMFFFSNFGCFFPGLHARRVFFSEITNIFRFYRSKRLLLPQTTFELFQTPPEFSSQWSSQKNYFGFFKFLVTIFPRFFFVSFSLTLDPMVAKTSKRYSSLQSLLNVSKHLLNFFLIDPYKTVFDF